ncbi:MAG TPA: hypothetical protein VIM71_07300 [Lacunisphaera sp.]
MNEPGNPSFSRAVRVACWLAFAAGLLANLLVWLSPRGASLDNGHAFRQFQTALTTRYLVREGFRFDYETPVLGPPWSIPMEFPVYQYTVAAAVRATGAPLESAGRAVSMLYFWAALPALWLLLGLWRVARETRLLVLALLLTCPVYLFYGRHFMIETTALCLGLWFLLAFVRAIRDGSLPFGLLAAALGIAASLAKITTFFSFGVAAVLVMAAEIRSRPREWRRLLVWSALIVLPALALTWLWVGHADELKGRNPIGGFLVSSKLHEFNFGPPGQRLQAGTWLKFYEVTRAKLAADAVLVLALVGMALVSRAQRGLAAASLLCFVTVLGVFTNLFYVHDYYFEATAVFLLVAIAFGLEGLLTHRPLPTALRCALVALVLVFQGAGFWREFGMHFTSPPPGPPPLAALLDRLTDSDDVLVVIGQDWNSRLLYYCDRRGLMVPGGYEQNLAALQQSVSLLGSRRVGALVVTSNFRQHPHAIVPLTRMMGLTPRPIAEGDGAQIYLRQDRLAELATRLAGAEMPGFQIKRDYDPAKDLLNAEKEINLTAPEWRGKFPMASPAPARMTGIFPPGITDLAGVPVIGTHAPNSIYFDPPPGARHLVAVGGMFAGSYEKGGIETSDGVVVEVWESLPDGNQQRHFQRMLFPRDHVGDRDEFTIEVKLDRPFSGPVYLRVDPGPAEQINYDWVYWRSVKID